MIDRSKTIHVHPVSEEKTSKLFKDYLKRLRTNIELIADPEIELAYFDINVDVQVVGVLGKLKSSWEVLKSSTLQLEVFLESENVRPLVRQLQDVQDHMVSQVPLVSSLNSSDDRDWGTHFRVVKTGVRADLRFPSRGIMQITDRTRGIGFVIWCHCGSEEHSLPFDMSFEKTTGDIKIEFFASTKLYIHSYVDEPFWKYWLRKLDVCRKIWLGETLSLTHDVTIGSYHQLQDMLVSIDLGCDKLEDRYESQIRK